jgi:hypothetical protein
MQPMPPAHAAGIGFSAYPRDTVDRPAPGLGARSGTLPLSLSPIDAARRAKRLHRRNVICANAATNPNVGFPHGAAGMDRIREVAFFCVGRAVFFGSLAIGCVMVGFSFSPVSAFRSGALLTLIMATILYWKAASAESRSPKTTEVWLYLDGDSRPPDAQARQIVGGILKEVYGRFAQFALVGAAGLFAISLVFMALGFEPFQPPG